MSDKQDMDEHRRVSKRLRGSNQTEKMISNAVAAALIPCGRPDPRPGAMTPSSSLAKGFKSDKAAAFCRRREKGKQADSLTLSRGASGWVYRMDQSAFGRIVITYLHGGLMG